MYVYEPHGVEMTEYISKLALSYVDGIVPESIENRTSAYSMIRKAVVRDDVEDIFGQLRFCQNNVILPAGREIRGFFFVSCKGRQA